MNLETLEKLLSDFKEQEAIADEEIKVVEQQIEELTAKIAENKERLEIVATDRQEILEMKERYAGNGLGLTKSAVSEPAKKEESKPKIKLTKPKVSASPVKAKAKASAAPKVEDKPAAPKKEKVETSEIDDSEFSQAEVGQEKAAEAPAAEEKPKTEAPAAEEKPKTEAPAAEEKAKPEEPAAGEKAEEESSEESSDDDETVKSINDALRGLFR